MADGAQRGVQGWLTGAVVQVPHRADWRMTQADL